MRKHSRPPRKYHHLLWVPGLLGFMGFRYLFSHHGSDLFYFSFFSFFSTWFTARLASEMPDERYEENRLKAKSVTMFVPAIVLFLIGCGLTWKVLSPEFVVLMAAIGWVATFITYAVAFWYYEKH